MLATLVLVLAAAASEPAVPMVPVHIEISGNPKFSAGELARALAPRLPPDVPAGILSVSARPDGTIELSWQNRKRVLDLGEESGPAAARLVALLAADLFPLLGLPSVLPPAIDHPEIVPTTLKARTLFSLAAGYSLWSCVGCGPLLQGPTLGVGIDRNRLRLRAEGAWLLGAPHPLLDMTAWPFRLGAGMGISYLSVLGFLVMVPYRLDGVVNLTRALMGAGMGLETRFPLAAGFALRVNAGVDFFLGKRLQVLDGDTTLFHSSLWALRLGVALAWGRAR